MFVMFLRKKLVRLGFLFMLQFVIVTVLLTPIRIIAVLDLPEENMLPIDVQNKSMETRTETTLMKVQDNPLLTQNNITYASKHLENEQNEVQRLENVERKIEILRQHIPLMLKLYDKGIISNPPLPLGNMSGDSVCKLFAEEATIRRHVIINVFNEQLPKGTNSSITLATQGTLSRLSALLLTAQNWAGPMQVVLHLDKEDIVNLSSVMKNKDFQKHLLERNNIVFSFVIKIGNFYPINHLRNIGLNNTNTKWVFLTDIDFVPNKKLYHNIHSFLDKESSALAKKVYVVPAFSALISNLSYFPNDKEELKKLWLQKQEIRESQKGRAGQKRTNYKHWQNALLPYQVKWSSDYEPYIIGPTKELPKYNEHFLQRVLDKCSHIMETNAKGFSFWVLPDSFTLHILHAKKPNEEYHAGCAVKYYHKQFKLWVKNHYHPKQPPRKHK